MQEFLEDVNHARVMRFFAEVFAKKAADGGPVKIAERHVYVGDEPASGVKREQPIERRISMDEERLDRIEGVEFVMGEDTPAGDREVIDFRFGDMEEIPGDAGEDEGDCHDGAIGIERPGDDEDEGDGDDNLRFRSQFEGIVLGRAPLEEYVSEIRRERSVFHRFVLVVASFFHYTTKYLQSAARLLGFRV